jgi:uncharacterized membrane protein
MANLLNRARRILDVRRIEAAIRAAEVRSSGEVRVSVSPFFWGDVRRAGERAFERLGMMRTREHNGVLFFIVPSRRAFVVLGDRGIHGRVGDELWHRVVAAMSPYFARHEFTEGVLLGIELVADALAQHFPPDPTSNPNELPDSIDFGGGS